MKPSGPNLEIWQGQAAGIQTLATANVVVSDTVTMRVGFRNHFREAFTTVYQDSTTGDGYLQSEDVITRYVPATAFAVPGVYLWELEVTSTSGLQKMWRNGVIAVHETLPKLAADLL